MSKSLGAFATSWNSIMRGYYGVERRVVADQNLHPAAQVKSEFDTFDLLFINAGFSIPTPLESVSDAVYDEMFNLNAKVLFSRSRNARR